MAEVTFESLCVDWCCFAMFAGGWVGGSCASDFPL